MIFFLHNLTFFSMNKPVFLANDLFTEEDNAFMLECRQTIHRWPEGGFDLPRTVAFVESQLDSMGIEHIGKYGISGVVGYINYGATCSSAGVSDTGHPYTVAIRADEDVRMGIVTDVKQELRRCSALKIMYAARTPAE